LGLSLEPVTDIANRLDIDRIVRIGLDFRAQGGDAPIHTALRHRHGIPPDSVEDGVARQSAARPRGEVLEQPEFFRRELDFHSAPEKFVRRQAQLVIAEMADLRLCAFPPPQERIHPRHQFANVERLGNAPALTFQVDPEYSEEARKAKYSGVVVLSIEVDQTGHTRNLRVAKGVGLGLDEKAIEAVKQWRFKPGLKNGKPVIVRAQVEVNFRLL
jgi:TonB family protein